MQQQVQIYINAFTLLKRGATQYGLAPHKPVLLLTLFELIEKGLVNDNRFIVNADLKDKIKESYFQE